MTVEKRTHPGARKGKEILTIEDLPENALVAEVAEFFRTSVEVVREWLSDNKFPNAYKPGRSFLIPKKDVIKFMETNYGQR